MSEFKNFIQKLQNSDRPTKKRWLIGATSVTMLIVIVLWGFYFNYLIKNLNETRDRETAPAFTEVFKAGFKILSRETWDQVKAIVGNGRSLTILGADLNFVVENLAEIKPKTLP